MSEPGMVEGVKAHDVGGEYALQQFFAMRESPAGEKMASRDMISSHIK